MSRSVRRVLSRTSGGDLLSRTFVAKRLKQPTRRRRAGRPYLLLGLALGGVYQAGSVTQTAGELLPRLFTLTACAAVYFLWHYPSGHPGWLLAITLPCRARTFLENRVVRAVAQPTHPRT